MPPAPRLILLGLRTSGKTTLGALAANKLNLPFLDLDSLTAKVLDQPSAGDAIRHLGLKAFRAGEVRALRMPEAKSAGVLSLGGGTPTDPDAQATLAEMQKSGSRIVYLRAAPAILRARMVKTDLSTRPSLTGKSPIDEVEQIFRERDPVFRSVADVTIDVDALTEETALAAVLATLG
ncbi:MAG: shikimate kinase [Phycisphaeraceae bacterium]|nr:shikimate kinase [Phycisphaeraceae bacterium]